MIHFGPAFSVVPPLVLEQRSCLQEFSALSIFSFPRHCWNFWNCLHSQLDDPGSTVDAEENKRVSETPIFASAHFALLATLFWSLTIKVWFE